MSDRTPSARFSDAAGGTASGVVLVTGATGVLGARLVRALRARGFSVRGLSPPGDPGRARLDGLGCTLVEGDVRNAGAVPGLFAGIDTVYHLAAVILSPDPQVFETVNRQGTAEMVTAAARAGVRHFVYVSSASVTYPKLTPYGHSKLAGEALVKAETRFQHTIVRPTLVYDEGGGQEFQLFLRYLQRWPVVPFIGDGRAWKRPVFAGDVVDGLAAIAGNQKSYGKTYNLSGADRIRLIDLARLMLAHHDGFGQHRFLLPIPVMFAKAAARCMGALMKDPPLTLQAIAGLVNDADLPPDEAMRDLGYRPTDIRSGFARCFSQRNPAFHVANSGVEPVTKEIVT
ncbi:MAG TPA: NAD-dependent epimerase/dehydratase family protein [Polyangia bacterium]